MLEVPFVVGGLFGVRHTFEADHVAAVATLVEDDDRPVTAGFVWGLGHCLPVVLLGSLFLALGVELPALVGRVIEFAVAVLLIGLGVRVLLDRPPIGSRLLGHDHTDEASFLVGIVHGFAGSGGVVVALAAAAGSTFAGAGFLAGFSVATIVGMSVASWGVGHAVSRLRPLRLVTGLASIVVGLLLGVEMLGISL
ncbi:MAG: hypothetical protein U5K28_01520 [Halobacteriales archaeon]|nr:hypothetical protein [Halobacteriales archaeon]